MKYVTYSEIDKNSDYLVIGCRNVTGQLDVAKLNLSLLDEYYITPEKLQYLSAKVDFLSGFLSSCLNFLSADSLGNKITVPELSAYCSYNRYLSMKDERTFVGTDEFMNYLKDNFRSINQVSADTRLSAVGKPLLIAKDAIEQMASEAYTLKEE